LLKPQVLLPRAFTSARTAYSIIQNLLAHNSLEPHADARLFEMTNLEESLTFTDNTGNHIAGILATPTGGTHRLTVLCHGFLSSKNSATNKALTAMLIPLGIATLRFDFLGHGESGGPFEGLTVGAAVQQTLAAIMVGASRGYRDVALVGSSFGGLVAILAAAEHSKLACLALKCPVSDFPQMLRDELGADGIRQWQTTNTLPDFAQGLARIRLPFSFYEDCAHHSAYAAAEVVQSPTLIVHGEADESVPVAHSLRLEQALRGKASCVVLPGADHHFSNPLHFRQMVTHLASWVADHLGRGVGD
jgi:uncharacterized protein